jgi:nitrous oxide reductase accessory protein NosL
MKKQTRREFLLKSSFAAALATVNPMVLLARTPCQVDHPLNPPHSSFEERCPNCGMPRARWARTWKTFAIGETVYSVCSFHCMADMAAKSGQTLSNVKTALYLEPEVLHAAESATFVIGSSAAGTMTLKSKAAFASPSAAREFLETCGGQMADYAETLALAVADLERENTMIDRKRLDSGTIAVPVDGVDECPVCLMFPARYPRHRCQVRSKDDAVFHFCSTQCLFGFLENPRMHARREIQPAMIWVSDYDGSRWISARTAHYVLGSKKWGPMGREAFAFDRIDAARRFQKRHGGYIQQYDAVTLHAIKTR